MKTIAELIPVGSVLRGFCNGYFGRDAYADKTVIAVGEHKGVNWILVQEELFGELLLASAVPADIYNHWARQMRKAEVNHHDE